MEHYYPFGMADEAAEQGAFTDTYAVISIQDSHTQGFGFQFAENQFCKGVLTLYFDDIVTEVDGAVLFDDDMADQIIEFTKKIVNLRIRCSSIVMPDNLVPKQSERLRLRCSAAIIAGTLRKARRISIFTMCWSLLGSESN